MEVFNLLNFLMRKVILSLFFCALNLVVLAQTEFKNLNYNDALAMAKAEDKMVFIDFYTDWCGPCKRMAKEVFPRKEIGDYLNSRYVCIQLNAEKDGKNLAKTLHVDAYPTFIVLDTTGHPLFRIVGGMDETRFINRMEENINPEFSPARVAERYAAGERTPKVIEFYVSSLMRNCKYAEGIDVVEDSFNSLSNEQRMREDNLFLYLRYTVDWNNDRAQFFIDHHDDFDGATKEKINKHFIFLYQNEIKRYFLGSIFQNKEFNDRQYQILKQKAILLPKEMLKELKPVFKLIEYSAVADYEKYIKTCIVEFDKLDIYKQELLIKNIARIINNMNYTSQRAVTKFARSQLNKRSSKAVVFTSKLLEELSQHQE